jgi:hypothetical protein
LQAFAEYDNLQEEHMLMRIITFTVLLVLGFAQNINAQFSDNFSDGDFTNNPAWVGGTSDFIVNAAMQLQSNNTVASSNFYLATPNTKATSAQWDFYCQFTFNTSGTNYTDVYLTASASDLTNTNTTGYFVRIGNTDDEISLYRKDAGVAAIKIIDGLNGTTNTSNNTMRIRVIRNAANQFNLLRDLSGTGSSYTSEGTVIDATYTTSSFFGIWTRQSTASFFQRHFFDDFQVQDYVPDITPPAIVSATATSATTLDVLFNEGVTTASSQLATNYSVSNGIGNPVSAVRDVTNNALVHLSFANPFPARVNLTLTVNGVQDLSTNTLNNGTAIFSFFTAFQFDILIDEIMADPTPVVALPDAEWIELRNRSGFDINLQNWRVGKPSGQSGPMPNYLLKKDSLVVVCTGSAVTALSAFGPTISVTSFPSLGNAGDQLYLRSPEGNIIHSVNYTDSWYQNELKKEGGWTLEMIDINNPCSGVSNWKASVDPKGGTPAKKNSVDGINADVTAPKLLRAYAPDSITLVLVFSESLDSTSAAVAASYSISDGIGQPQTALPLSFSFDRVRLRLSTPLLRNKIYTVTASTITDCGGNAIATNNTARVGLYEPLLKYDIVVNEILFNPRSNGNDFVEIYNRSNKIITLRNTYIANRNTAGAVSSITQISIEDYLLFPGDYMVLTEDAELVTNNYVANNLDAFIELDLPSYNDDAGNVILLNEQGAVIDEIPYKDDWHYRLIGDEEGVSLERINYNDTTVDNTATPNIDEQAANWHSAATSAGYATPTYKNSQYLLEAGVQGTINTTPEIISPDNDGMDDFLTIDYNFPEPGYVASITVFDAAGRKVRHLQRNALTGTKGYFRWDGLGEKNEILTVGIYIVYTEIFNLQGKTKKFKNVVVLARKK